MAKFYSQIGYAKSVESSPGVWEEKMIKRNYYGEVVRSSRRLQTSDKVNDDVSLSNELSIVSDPFATQNFHNMRYISWMGTKWKITNVEVRYPRLVLTIGGVYNGK